MPNLLAAFAVVSMIVLTSVSRAPTAPSVAAPVAAPALSAGSATAAEPHPKIRAAVRALQAARADLQAAAHDFKGHRVDAIKAIDAAIVQLNLALQADP
jgi:hypothetical protein